MEAADSLPHFALPSRLLCHGLLRGIVWQGPDVNYLQPHGQGAAQSQPAVFPANPATHAGAYRIGIGHTAAEAMAALLAPSELEQDLLAALHDDILSQPVTAHELQHELHERRFGGVGGGTVFHLVQEPAQADPRRPAETPPPAAAEPIPAELRKLLRALNAAQEDCDCLHRRVEDCRWGVFAFWYLWTWELKNGVTEQTQPRLDQLAERRRRFEEGLEKERAEWHARRQELNGLKKRLADELGKYPRTPPYGTASTGDTGEIAAKYRLTSTLAPSFRRPNDPVIAVQGPAMARVAKQQAAGQPSDLPSRRPGGDWNHAAGTRGPAG